MFVQCLYFISGSGGQCFPYGNFELHNRYCGSVLNIRSQTANMIEPIPPADDTYLAQSVPICGEAINGLKGIF